MAQTLIHKFGEYKFSMKVIKKKIKEVKNKEKVNKYIYIYIYIDLPKLLKI